MSDWMFTKQGYYADGNVLDAPVLVVIHCTPPRIWQALIV